MSIDDLDADDLALVMSHVNSTPRRSLGGLSPVAAARRMLGEPVEALLGAYGIREVGPGELYLREDLVNRGRAERGLPPVEIRPKAR